MAAAVLVRGGARRAAREPHDHQVQDRARRPRDRDPGPRGVVVRSPIARRGCAGWSAERSTPGPSKHFVKYRDDRSPYGYDAVDIGAMPAGTDFMVHGDEFAQGYVREGDLPFAKLLFRLSIRKLPGGEHLERRGSRRAPAGRRARAVGGHHPLPVAQPGRGAGRPVHAGLAERVRRPRARPRLHADPRARAARADPRAVRRHARGSTCSARGRRAPRSRSATSTRSISRRAARCSRPIRSTCSGPTIASTCCPDRSSSATSRTSPASISSSIARREPTLARRRPAGADRRRAQARGVDGPAAPRGRDADPARARPAAQADPVRAASGQPARPPRRGRPIAASSWSDRRTST